MGVSQARGMMGGEARLLSPGGTPANPQMAIAMQQMMAGQQLLASGIALAGYNPNAQNSAAHIVGVAGTQAGMAGAMGGALSYPTSSGGAIPNSYAANSYLGSPPAPGAHAVAHRGVIGEAVDGDRDEQDEAQREEQGPEKLDRAALAVLGASPVASRAAHDVILRGEGFELLVSHAPVGGPGAAGSHASSAIWRVGRTAGLSRVRLAGRGLASQTHAASRRDERPGVYHNYHNYKERARLLGGDYSQSLLARKCDPTENENGTL